MHARARVCGINLCSADADYERVQNIPADDVPEMILFKEILIVFRSILGAARISTTMYHTLASASIDDIPIPSFPEY